MVEGLWALPEGWRWEMLPQAAEVCDFLRRPVNNAERLKRNAGKHHHELYPYFGATGQAGVIDSYLADGDYILLGEDGAPFLEPRKAKAYRVSGRFWVNNHAHVLKSRPHFDGRLLLHWLNTLRYEPYVNGTTRLKLTQRAMEGIPVPVPPRAIQLALAEKIENLFVELDDGERALARARTDLGTWRNALLKSAVTGELTADWRAAHPPAETGADLLARILNERRSKWASSQRNKSKTYAEPIPIDQSYCRSLPEGWGAASGDMLLNWASGKFLPDRLMGPGDVPVYGGNGIAGNHSASLIDYPTLVIGRVGYYCGNAFATSGPAWITDNAIYAQSIYESISPVFLRIVFEASDLRSRAQGGAQPFISQGLLNSIKICIPSLEEQSMIIKLVEDGLSVGQVTSTFANSMLDESNALRHSILAAAFRGELVA